MKIVAKLDREGMTQWLAAIANEGSEVIVPTEDSSRGVTNWTPLEKAGGFDVPTGVTARSVKEFFFPQPETLLECSRKKSDPDALLLRETGRQEGTRVVAGVRPCDARSVILNAMPYEDDPYFRKNRERTVLIGLSCDNPCGTCFCTETGGSPMGTEGLDIAVTELPEGGFIVEAGSERGEALTDLIGDQETVSGKEQAWLEEKREEWAGKAAGEKDLAETFRSTDMMKLYNAPFWQEIADSCINCGTCTFLCPTCYCFDIQDENMGGMSRRIRYWDSCMFPLFTKHASGHNPRGEKLQRCRNRFMHKMRYFPERFGPLSCVGCGRCLRLCPVNIDIREVVEKMLSVAGA